jgi:hypothetical protein
MLPGSGVVVTVVMLKVPMLWPAPLTTSIIAFPPLNVPSDLQPFGPVDARVLCPHIADVKLSVSSFSPIQSPSNGSQLMPPEKEPPVIVPVKVYTASEL